MNFEERHAIAQLRCVLRTALVGTYAAIDQMPLPITRNWARAVGRAWVLSLHNGFQEAYEGSTVFSRGRDREFLHDIFVGTMRAYAAPVRMAIAVPLEREMIWQAESEVELNARELAWDLKKLIAGSAENKLLVAAIPRATGHIEPWLNFISNIAATMSGNFFLALMPSYASQKGDPELWRQHHVCVQIYGRAAGLRLEALGTAIQA